MRTPSLCTPGSGGSTTWSTSAWPARPRLAFVAGQRDLLIRALDGEAPAGLAPEEELLVALARPGHDGLHQSLHSMLDVMEFDALRRGRPVPQERLDDYTRDLATAVTEALHHCIGRGCRSPQDARRYVAVTGAHIAHMLRDLGEDLPVGYINVPAELLPDGRVSFEDLHTPPLRAWVRDRVAVARACFATGRAYLAEVENPRCRLAGHAYIARFEWVLDAIESDGYRVRLGYPERGTLRGGLTIAADGARSAWTAARGRSAPAAVPVGRGALR